VSPERGGRGYEDRYPAASGERLVKNSDRFPGSYYEFVHEGGDPQFDRARGGQGWPERAKPYRQEDMIAQRGLDFRGLDFHSMGLNPYEHPEVAMLRGMVPDRRGGGMAASPDPSRPPISPNPQLPIDPREAFNQAHEPRAHVAAGGRDAGPDAGALQYAAEPEPDPQPDGDGGLRRRADAGRARAVSSC
jgi:hypothetical protein